ncbi:MAG: UDP-N-acetylmuramoyl-tripeptide--D-alanyl-D-alanine ligase [Thermosynechococcaceae cyanobacterium]
MSFQVALSQLIDVLRATTLHLSSDLRSRVAFGISTDTRTVQPGQLFLALRGEKFDGHGFVEQAIAAGAIAAIVESPIEAAVPQILVANTLQAYQTLGQWWRMQFRIPIVAITGSVGKTTTKEILAAALGTAGPVLKTEANFNNEIGVPKTLLNLNPDHHFAVIEMGMRGPGEIAELTRIAQPDIGLITNVGTAHIERLGSREAIARAKCELLAVMPATSTAILNAENPLLLETADTVWDGPTVTYGFSTGDLCGTLVDAKTLEVEGVQYPLPLPGEHNALNLLAAIAVLRTLHLDDHPLRQGLTVHLPDGRAQQYCLPNDIVLLDESYNAGAESMAAALKLLAQTPGTRRIAVLGPMKELGDFAEELHRNVGAQAEALGIDALYILDTGPEGTAIAQGTDTLPTRQFEDPNTLIDALVETVQAGDRLLFKASRAVKLDRVVVGLRDRLR